MQARVWQDYFLKERNQRVPMMTRSLKNINYYLSKEPDGCLGAFSGGKLVGSIISHVWGKVGWFGPLEVDAPSQGQGIGKALVLKSLDYLKSQGCTTMGCETMASSPKNIAFYMKMGFRARALSNVMYKRLAPLDPHRLRDNPARPFEKGDFAQAKDIWQAIQPGIDYSKELEVLAVHGLGEAFVTEEGAHAIVHNYEMFSESNNSIIKLVAAPPGSPEDVKTLLERCELSATQAGKSGMFLRTYDATPPDLKFLFAQGYVLQSNSIRLILQGEDESCEHYHISCWSG